MERKWREDHQKIEINMMVKNRCFGEQSWLYRKIFFHQTWLV